MWKADDWFDCAKWLHVVLFTWGAKIVQMILTIPEQQDAKARARAGKLSDQRHAKDREAREKVVRDWEKNPDRFLTAAEAGRHYTEWLAKQDYECEPSTPTRWIRRHAKKIGKKWR